MNSLKVESRMVAAATQWLDSLDADQLKMAAWPFPAEDERRLWFYTPTDHGGLPLSLMSPTQQRGAMRLLRSGLSGPAYVTAATIIGWENILDAHEHFDGQTFDRERGRDPGLYYVRVFGQPGPGATWSWRFGGHHLSVNHTVVEGTLTSWTPSFFGLSPASAPLLGPHLLRPLAGAEDLGRELVHSLDTGQFDRALLSPTAPGDLVTTNRPSARPGQAPPDYGTFRGRPDHDQWDPAVTLTVEPKGVRAADLSPTQREILHALLDVYIGRVPDELADTVTAKFAAGAAFDELAFGWAGGLRPGEPHYYRIQGSRLLAEYDNTQNDTNHIHTVLRDLDNDFGPDPLAQHYTAHHQHTSGHPTPPHGHA